MRYIFGQPISYLFACERDGVAAEGWIEGSAVGLGAPDCSQPSVAEYAIGMGVIEPASSCIPTEAVGPVAGMARVVGQASDGVQSVVARPREEDNNYGQTPASSGMTCHAGSPRGTFTDFRSQELTALEVGLAQHPVAHLDLGALCRPRFSCKLSGGQHCRQSLQWGDSRAERSRCMHRCVKRWFSAAAINQHLRQADRAPLETMRRSASSVKGWVAQ